MDRIPLSCNQRLPLQFLIGDIEMKSKASKSVIFGAILGGLLYSTALPASEINISQEKAAEQGEVVTAVDQANLAGQLAEYGRAARNPLAMMLAGEIAAGLGSVDADFVKQDNGEVAGSVEDKDSQALTFNAENLFAEARSLAGNDKALIAMIDAASSKESKGLVGGPIRHTDRVRANTIDVFELEFRAGRKAEILVVGDGDTDLDLFVYDEDDNFICSDEDPTDTTYCTWRPKWTGNYKVKIKNWGDVYNEYVLMTN